MNDSTSTAIKPAQKPTSEAGNWDVWHVFCCDENLALCGTDVTNFPITDGDGELMCVVCDELDSIPCEVCGA